MVLDFSRARRRYPWRNQAVSEVASGRQPISIIFISLCFTIFIFCYPASAGNERWKAITGKNGEDRILYDPDSVIPFGPGIFRVRTVSFNEGHSPKRSLEEIDCSNRIYRDIEVITEEPGKPIRHTFAPSEWRGIDRESPRGELTRILCR